MGNSKIELSNGIVLLDLTQDTVTAETLAKGITAHNKMGEIITGVMTSGGTAVKEIESGTYEPSSDMTEDFIYFNNPHTTYPKFFVIGAINENLDIALVKNTIYSMYHIYTGGMVGNRMMTFISNAPSSLSNACNGSTIVSSTTNSNKFTLGTYFQYWANGPGTTANNTEIYHGAYWVNKEWARIKSPNGSQLFRASLTYDWYAFWG